VSTLKVVLYALAVLSSLTCTVLLLQGYARRRIRLLMWSGICFAGLTVNNLALFFDQVIYPDENLRLWRLIPALVAMMFLLYGFIWDAE
jgi:hypothetical protein